jgi:hypothetical protein
LEDLFSLHENAVRLNKTAAAIVVVILRSFILI